MPTPNVTAPPAQQPKTLPHALARAAAQSSNALNTPSGETRLGQALKEYALAFEKIGAARLDQDDGELADDSGVMTFYPYIAFAAIVARFLAPWQVSSYCCNFKPRCSNKKAKVTLQNSIAIAVRARQAVRVSRLELDTAKQT